MNSDVICLTETQLVSNDINNDLKIQYPDHQLFIHSNNDRFRSLALLSKQVVNTSILECYDSVLIFKCHLSRIDLPSSLQILLLNRSNTERLQQYSEYILYLVNSKRPDIILGDFNINAISQPSPALLCQIQDMGYRQVVKEPTHISGGTIDHIYLSTHLLNSFQHIIHITPLYYSDHDAVSIQFM